MLNQKLLWAVHENMLKTLNLTLSSKVNVVSVSRMCATHRLMMILPCTSYGKPMSNQKQVMDRTQTCTNGRRYRRTNRWTDKVIPIFHLNCDYEGVTIDFLDVLYFFREWRPTILNHLSVTKAPKWIRPKLSSNEKNFKDKKKYVLLESSTHM